jgi:hypothetical protein
MRSCTQYIRVCNKAKRLRLSLGVQELHGGATSGTAFDNSSSLSWEPCTGTASAKKRSAPLIGKSKDVLRPNETSEHPRDVISEVVLEDEVAIVVTTADLASELEPAMRTRTATWISAHLPDSDERLSVPSGSQAWSAPSPSAVYSEYATVTRHRSRSAGTAHRGTYNRSCRPAKE